MSSRSTPLRSPISSPADEHEGSYDWESPQVSVIVRQMVEEADAEGDENSGKGMEGKAALRMLRQELAALP